MKHINEKIVIALIIIASVLIRFINFSDRITFGPEQALFSSVSADYIKEKFSLLGHQYFRTTDFGHQLFHGAQFDYSLVPLLLISNFDPVKLTIFFPILNILTGVLMMLLFKDYVGKTPAIIAGTLFLFDPLMVYHSMFLWDLNYLPLIGLALVQFHYQLFKQYKVFIVLLIGILSGIGIGIDYGFIPTVLLSFLLVILACRHKYITSSLLFVLGLLLGNAPMVVFDLKHDLYHLKTLLSYTFSAAKTTGVPVSYYHFLQFIPLLYLIIGLLFYRFLYKRFGRISLLIIIIVVALNMTSPKISFTKPIGMPLGTTVSTFKKAGQIIANDNPKNYNLVTLLDFDTRSYPLRYLLTYVHGYKPLGITEYPNAQELYILARNTYPINQPQVWELKTFLPYQVSILATIEPDLVIYKLYK